MNTCHQMSSSNSIHSLAPASLSPAKSPFLPPSLPSTFPTTTQYLHLSLSMDICCTRTIILLLALLLSLMTPGSHALNSLEFRPAAVAVEPQVVLELPQDGARRRRLGPFQLCLACKCCASASPAPVCVTMPCCFGIDCQLPNKPFGVCAFVPKSCNCTSCPV